VPLCLLQIPWAGLELNPSWLVGSQWPTWAVAWHMLYLLQIKIDPVYSLLSLFWKNKSRLMRLLCCLCICVSTLNAWTSLYETKHVYHGTWVHLNSILNKSLSFSLCVCISLLLLGNSSVKTLPWQQIHNKRRTVGCIVFYSVLVSKESRRLVLPRICFFFFFYSLHLPIPL
jgi:hypothetical protein